MMEVPKKLLHILNPLGRTGVSPITLPGTPAAVYSAVRLSTWTGNFAQIQRVSDNATFNIPFKGNVPDYVAAAAFVGGSTAGYSKLYDQSGNGRDVTQSTAANQPSFSTTALVNGMLPVIFDGIYNSVGKSLLIPASLSLSRVNFSVFSAIRQVISYEDQNLFEFTSGASTYLSNFISTAFSDTGVNTYDGTVIASSGIRPRGQMTTWGLRSNASNLIFHVNGSTSTQAGSTAQTMNAGGQIGQAISQSIYNLQSDLFAMVFYASDIGATNAASVLSAYNNAFSVPQTFTTRLSYGGSSLITSYGATLNQTLIRKIGLPSTVEVYNFGRLNGQSLATEYANRATELGMYDAAKRNIFVIDAPSNDIAGHAAFASAAAAQTYGDDTYNNVTVPFVQAILATGGAAVVPTIISRTGWDTTTNFYETARVRYNANVVAGATAHGYTLADRAGNALLGAQNACTNLTYFINDAIHPNDAGYSLMAAIDGPAILALVNASSFHFGTTAQYLDPLITVSASGLVAVAGAAISGNGAQVIGPPGASSGKRYYAASIGSVTPAAGIGFGLATDQFTVATTYLGGNASSICLFGNASVTFNNTLLASYFTLVANDVCELAVDITNKLAWFRKNGGNWNNNGSANPATGVGGLDISAMVGTTFRPAFSMQNSGEQWAINNSLTPPSGFTYFGG